MVIEEAREVLQEQIDKYGQEYDTEAIDALEVAIEALGSWEKFSDKVWKRAYARGCNDVLTMIRAEIESCREDEEPHLCDYRYHRNEGLDMALEIINKYRESEENA
jgi:hypothetical protein